MTKQEIIRETAQFYGEDTSRRSVSEGNCRYLGPNGKRCALSRCCVENKKNNRILKASESGTASVVLNREIKMKPGYEGHPTIFWEDVQCLHDQPENWNENGLTELGKRQVESLLARYAD